MADTKIALIRAVFSNCENIFKGGACADTCYKTGGAFESSRYYLPIIVTTEGFP
jgi:hypothetical protein